MLRHLFAVLSHALETSRISYLVHSASAYSTVLCTALAIMGIMHTLMCCTGGSAAS